MGIPGFEDIDGLIDFLEMFACWWAMMEIANTTQWISKRLPDKMPFSSPDDPKWLLKWLDDWKKSAAPSEFPTRQTYRAIRLTTISFVHCIKYMLALGVQFALTRKFSTDVLEQRHGTIRFLCGSNDTLGVAAALAAAERIIRTGIAYA